MTRDGAQGAIEEIESDVEVDGLETRRRGFALAPGYFLALAAVAVLVLAVVVGLWLTSTGGAAESRAPRIGLPAPDFTLKDVETGEPVSLSSLRGKPVWINFWATWCEDCREEMPAMQIVYDQYRDRGLVLLGVDAQESPEAVNKYISEGGFTWTFLLDTDGSVLDKYYVFGIPTHFFIGRDGVIKGIEVGRPPAETVERHLAEIMKQ